MFESESTRNPSIVDLYCKGTLSVEHSPERDVFNGTAIVLTRLRRAYCLALWTDESSILKGRSAICTSSPDPRRICSNGLADLPPTSVPLVEFKSSIQTSLCRSRRHTGNLQGRRRGQVEHLPPVRRVGDAGGSRHGPRIPVLRQRRT